MLDTPSRSTKPTAVEAVSNEASKTGSAADSLKLDNRKRTRQSLQSPMAETTAATTTATTPASTPSSGKRYRRI